MLQVNAWCVLVCSVERNVYIENAKTSYEPVTPNITRVPLLQAHKSTLTRKEGSNLKAKSDQS